MPTSFHHGRLLQGNPPTQYDAIGASNTRDFVVNNLLHYADIFAQVRAAMALTKSTYSGGQGSISGYGSPDADVWYPILDVGPFPIPLRADGSSYRLRIRIGGASSTGHAVKFLACLAPSATAALGLANDIADDFQFETVTTSSTTHAWLTGASRGSEAWETQIVVPAIYAAAWTQTTDTLDDLGGDAVSVDQCLVHLVILGSTANAASVPQLSGLYAAEWIGD